MEHEDWPRRGTRINQNAARGLTKTTLTDSTKKDEEEDCAPKKGKESGAVLALIFDLRRSKAIISSYQLSE